MIRCCLIGLLAAATPLAAQGRAQPFLISDNSFLVEEAFNQEAGVFQNVLLVQRPSAAAWSVEFTQEWPLGGQRHQLSYTVPLEVVQRASGDGFRTTRGTVALHYRYQLSTEESGGMATSPRLSVLIPRMPDTDRHFGLQSVQGREAATWAESRLA